MDEMNNTNDINAEQINDAASLCDAPVNEQNTVINDFANNDCPKSDTTYSYQYQPKVTAVPVNTPSAAPLSDDEQKSKSKGKVSMILGIIGAGLLVSTSAVFSLPAIVLGIIALVFASQSKKLSGENKLKGMAIPGYVCGLVSVILGSILFVVLILIIVLLGEELTDFDKLMENYELLSALYV